ncbi:MAG: hypothetical protein ABS89_00210 [Thiobacillus sp. SCN 63-1177]|nr:MAG: hypothetical protein ABS89_00210 [Thiobacillus sp. SCN 63-1177]
MEVLTTPTCADLDTGYPLPAMFADKLFQALIATVARVNIDNGKASFPNMQTDVCIGPFFPPRANLAFVGCGFILPPSNQWLFSTRLDRENWQADCGIGYGGVD